MKLEYLPAALCGASFPRWQNAVLRNKHILHFCLTLQAFNPCEWGWVEVLRQMHEFVALSLMRFASAGKCLHRSMNQRRKTQTAAFSNDDWKVKFGVKKVLLKTHPEQLCAALQVSHLQSTGYSYLTYMWHGGRPKPCFCSFHQILDILHTCSEET